MRKKPETRVTTLGRDPHANFGIVNPPVYHASTVLYPSLAELRAHRQPVTYGRRGTPTTFALQEAIADLEGGHRTVLTPSGLSACTTALLSYVEAGDHILVTDSVYAPTRAFCDGHLKRMGVDTEYFDPRIGGGIATLLRENTRLVFTESPGSLTFEVQDIPAIAAAAHAAGALVIIDNTWGTPLYFRPFEHGCDVSVQACTKYVVGHSDAMLGSVTASEDAWERLHRTHGQIGLCAGPDDVYLGLRGLRTLATRLRQHEATGLALARYLEARDDVVRVLHPALESHPDHALWKRDFEGACGLFAFEVEAADDAVLAAFFDTLELYGMGYSWGGFESLAIPAEPRANRTAVAWDSPHQLVRIHAGLEDPDDLIADIGHALDRLAEARA